MLPPCQVSIGTDILREAMPTVGERLARLEALAADNRTRIDALHDDIHGGQGVEWKNSIRGRLHAMSSAIDAADKLAEATRELVREQSRQRQSRFKTWQWVAATILALLAVLNPYLVLLLH